MDRKVGIHTGYTKKNVDGHAKIYMYITTWIMCIDLANEMISLSKKWKIFNWYMHKKCFSFLFRCVSILAGREKSELIHSNVYGFVLKSINIELIFHIYQYNLRSCIHLFRNSPANVWINQISPTHLALAKDTENENKKQKKNHRDRCVCVHEFENSARIRFPIAAFLLDILHEVMMNLSSNLRANNINHNW